jgi:hypothetical protein
LPKRPLKLKIHLIKSYNLAFYTKVEQLFFFICLCIMLIFKSPRVHWRACVVNTFHSCFNLSDHWSVNLNAVLVMAFFLWWVKLFLNTNNRKFLLRTLCWSSYEDEVLYQHFTWKKLRVRSSVVYSVSVSCCNNQTNQNSDNWFRCTEQTYK